jgi:hypothetical protein
MDETPKVMPVMVSFFTDGWTQQCIRCFQDWFPELKILVVDNNPTSADQIKGWNWCGNAGQKWKCFFKYCLAERDWLEKQSNVILLKPDRKNNQQITHGKCIDLAADWCKENNFDIMLCVEPDNFFDKVEWFYALLEPLVLEDYWMTGRNYGRNLLSHAVHPCPLMIKVNRIKCECECEWSFDHVKKEKQYYDFAQWVWQKGHERGQAKLVDVEVPVHHHHGWKGFRHFWSGSYNNFISNQRNCPLVTFL